MIIIVCVKQVLNQPMFDFNPNLNTIKREQTVLVNNPNDLGAVEVGLRIKEAYGGEVTVLSMGPKQCIANLRDILSLGADRAILLSSPAFAGADTLATSYTLAAAIRKIGDFDLVITGRQSLDGETGQIGPGLAEHLNIPHITNVGKDVNVDGKRGIITVQKRHEKGIWKLNCEIPALLSVSKNIIEHRCATLINKVTANKVEILVWTEADLKVDLKRIGLAGSPTKVINVYKYPVKKINSKKYVFIKDQEQVLRLFNKLLKGAL
jgi:electron transfer flavoprotein beta subunit